MGVSFGVEIAREDTSEFLEEYGQESGCLLLFIGLLLGVGAGGASRAETNMQQLPLC